MIETATFVCSICGETSTDICVYCTKDTCANHRCLRCLRCSDCCECEVPVTAGEPEREPSTPPVHAEPMPEPPQPQAEPVAEGEPIAEAEPATEAEPEPVLDSEPHLEMPGVAAVVLPEPEVAPAVEQATTPEELVRALPELFAPDPESGPNPPAPRNQIDEDEKPRPSAEHEESSEI